MSKENSTASSPARRPVTPQPDVVALPDRDRLERIFRLKYGEPGELGWGPRMRRRFSYYTPDDVYEAVVDSLVGAGCAWLDVGCGRDLFPNNAALARQISERAGSLVGVDPAPTIEENPDLHESVRASIEDFESDRAFDLVTLRMVAEHVERPERVLAALARCTGPGGHVVVYTVNRFSPVPLITGIVPFALHHPVKRVLWRSEKKDTFPTCFRMNTRRNLRELFAAAGFDEAGFYYLDDCRTFGRFRPLAFAELCVRWCLRRFGLRYPENCLLGIYRRS